MKVYTGMGDKGETDLCGGVRTRKDSVRVSAYGGIDELNSILGVLITMIEHKDIADIIKRLQNELHICCADLANLDLKEERYRIKPRHTEDLEALMGNYDKELAPLTKFILPGGSKAGAMMHFARTICRRCERAVVGLSRQDKINPEVLRYLNRLSSLLFVLARVINKREAVEETYPEY